MIKQNRRGVIGFLLTMAVGAALGAAALVVSSEIKKDIGSETLKAASDPSSPAAVEKAFEDYQQAYKAYQQAVGLGRKDIAKYASAYREAKRRLELEIFRNTPGVSDMDMNKFEAHSNASSDGSDIANNNPFAGNEIVLTADDSSATTLGQSGSLTEKSGIVGMDYYRVKSGDSLSRICQRYYGNSGMWSHILKYQIPGIAATPNLIFPGQLIALPRGLIPGKNENTQISQSYDSNAVGESREVAPVGDESWQNSFQKDYLVSDYSLTNADSMSAADIQRFLDTKGSCLARSYRGSTPAKMIYDAAKKYGINPQILLCRLQCEQGLVSRKTASQRQLDWALGVGCYDSGNWNQRFRGLDKQIEFAAATYRRHFDSARKRIDSGEKITMTIDGQPVTVKNAASYSFYKYCPHFQGNKLFYDVWKGYKKSF